MSPSAHTGYRPARGWFAGVALAAAAVVGLAACGSSSKPKAASTSTTAGSASSTASSSSPGTKFSAASVPGLGMVVVDGRGRTVYNLTSGTKKNVPCEDSTGCTKTWPDLPLPEGTSAATVGAGLQASLLGTMKLSDGETYATYGGFLMYEYTGDTGPAQGHGQGIASFGGTWYAITPAGTSATAAATSGSGGSGTSAGY